MRRFRSIKDLTREELEERMDKAAAQFLRSRDAESRREVIELHHRLKELDDEKRGQIPVPVLQLRDHPMMKRDSGHVVWPPAWRRFGDDAIATDEIGYLERVRVKPDLKACIFLTIDHNGSNYMGSMTFDDSVFCLQLCELLKSKIGRSIREIGDLDVSHLL